MHAVTCALVMLGVLAGTARADRVEDPCACSPAKPGFFRRGRLTGDWGELRPRLERAGFVPQLVYAGEVYAAPHLHDRVVAAGLLVLSVDLELGKLVAPHLGQLHASGLAIHGDGLSAELMDIYGVSGNVAPEDVRLFEAWVDQPLGPVAVRAGLLAVDQEFVLAAHSTALLDATFGIISQLSYNLLGPVYPVATPGASVRLEGAGVGARAAVYDGTERNDHGLPAGLGPDVLAIGEVELRHLLQVGAWHHTSRGNGFYAIVDHQLDRYLAAFARAGVSPGQAVPFYVDTGIRIGPGPLRPHDFIGLGLAFARDRDPEVGSQTLVEATYQAQFGWLTIQPDAQLLLEHARTAEIVATRATIVF